MTFWTDSREPKYLFPKWSAKMVDGNNFEVPKYAARYNEFGSNKEWLDWQPFNNKVK